MAVVHTATALAAALRSKHLNRVWAVTAWGSLLYLLWIAWIVLSAAAYIASLYRGLGAGVGIGLCLAVALVALVTLPYAVWGIVSTRALLVRFRKGLGLGALSVFLLFGGGLMNRSASAASSALPLPPRETLNAKALKEVLPGPQALRPKPKFWSSSLFHRQPATCERAIGGASKEGGQSSVLLSYLVMHKGEAKAQARCIQADPEAIWEKVAQQLKAEALQGPVKIDVITGWQSLASESAFLDAFKLRPGLDGVCEGDRCLAPWQLVAGDHFTDFKPLPFIPDLRIGFSAEALREQLGTSLGEGDPTSLDGFVRISTESFVLSAEGEVLSLQRMHEREPSLDEARIEEALAGAERYIVKAQEKNGRFLYRFDPFTGKRSKSGRLNLPRQAGTTLVLCELGQENLEVRGAVERSLEHMAEKRREWEDLSALIPSKKGSRATLGDSALPLIAFLQCRPRVGDRHDELIGRLGHLLLKMQRPDGGFNPAFDVTSGAVEVGSEPLYAGGQAVFALSALEKLSRERAEKGGKATALPRPEELGAAVERAMDYVADRYWNHAMYDFFFLEENWHCLAARASLEHHRHDGYERFCIDYNRFKARIPLDEGDGVEHDFVGGFGWGNVVPPHNTGTAGYLEGLVAAMTLKEARGESYEDDLPNLRRGLRFLIRQQWRESTCFACVRGRRAFGAFSESMASPTVRIDYVQHAWAAVGHGHRFLRGDEAVEAEGVR